MSTPPSKVPMTSEAQIYWTSLWGAVRQLDLLPDHREGVTHRAVGVPPPKMATPEVFTAVVRAVP